MASQHPSIGAWYHDVANDAVFEVVALDEKAGSVEIQYDNGDIDEFDLDLWNPVLFVATEPPAILFDYAQEEGGDDAIEPWQTLDNSDFDPLTPGDFEDF